MKFRVTMKTPDALHDAAQQAVEDEINALHGLSYKGREIVIDERVDATHNLCNQWFKHGECLTVEIDTEANTCVVCHAR